MTEAEWLACNDLTALEDLRMTKTKVTDAGQA